METRKVKRKEVDEFCKVQHSPSSTQASLNSDLRDSISEKLSKPQKGEIKADESGDFWDPRPGQSRGGPLEKYRRETMFLLGWL